MMMKARWTTTSASATSASTAARSSTSPWRYSVLRRPCAAGSNGRRAMPSTRPTVRERSQARRKARPMSPVGPVTATVSGSGAIAGFSGEHDAGHLALDHDHRLERLDLATFRPLEQLVGRAEARQRLQRLDRREDEIDPGVERRPWRVPAHVDGLAAVGPRLGAVRGGDEEEQRVEPDPHLRRRDP